MGEADKAFPLRGRCPSAHTGADEVSSRFRSFLSRLRMAWLVLIGKTAPPASCSPCSSPSGGRCPDGADEGEHPPVRLRSSWWAHGPDLTHARDMVRRELCDGASRYILYTDEESCEDGGYIVSGDLYIYAKEASHEH